MVMGLVAGDRLEGTWESDPGTSRLFGTFEFVMDADGEIIRGWYFHDQEDAKIRYPGRRLWSAVRRDREPDPYADEWVVWKPGQPASTEGLSQPDFALGEPDFEGSNDDPAIATLGCGGQLIVRFSDNDLADGPGADLRIYEPGDAEAFAVEISIDGAAWRALGPVGSNTTDFDISDVAAQDEAFRFVRITDLKSFCSGTRPGADIDAVQALNSRAAECEPGVTPDIVSAHGVCGCIGGRWRYTSIAGRWGDTEGGAEISVQSDGTVLGLRRGHDNWRYFGRLSDRRMTGVWVEDDSSERCETPVDGSYHWGRDNVVFDETLTSGEVKWGYCNSEPSHAGVTRRPGCEAPAADTATDEPPGEIVLTAPAHFAPGHEDLALDIAWPAAAAAPASARLVIRGKGAGGTLVHDAVVPLEALPQGWQVRWRQQENATVDWARLAPFAISVEIRDAEDRLYAGATTTTVVVAGLTLAVEVPAKPTGDAAAWYDDNEIAADIGHIAAGAAVTIFDSLDAPRPLACCIDVHWEATVETLAETAPRRWGFFVPGSDPAENLDLPLEEGASRAWFRMPARSGHQDPGTLNPIAADRFSLQASIPGFEGATGSSATYVIGPGRPHEIRQLSVEEIRSRFHGADEGGNAVSNNFDFEYLEDLLDYADNMATYATKLGFDNSPLRDALVEALADKGFHPVRFLGIVEGVPYRSFWGDKLVDIPVFLAGYAGDRHARLRGGQALLVLFDVRDRYGNPVPVVGERARKVVTTVTDNGESRIPPLILSSPDGTPTFRYRAAVTYSPFGPATTAAPLGIHGFYYVPGVQSYTGELETELDALQAQLKEYGESFLAPTDLSGLGEIDSRLSVHVEIDGERYAERSDFRLIEPGSFRAAPEPLRDLTKWLFLGEVSSIDIFKAEVALGVIPIVGDGRDLAIYFYQWASGKTLEPLDKIGVALAGIGLLADAGDFNPAGVALNAFVASGKATVKMTKRLYRGRKIVIALAEHLGPLADAAFAALKDPKNAGALFALIREVHRTKPIVELVENSALSGGVSLVRARMDKLADALDACNPETCLITLGRLRPDAMGKLIDEANFSLNELTALSNLLVARGLGKDIPALADATVRLGERVSDTAVENVLEFLHAFEKSQPADANISAAAALLATLADHAGPALRAADPILRSPQFKKAALDNPRLIWEFVAILTTHKLDAVTLFKAGGTSSQGYARLLHLIELARGPRLEPGDLPMPGGDIVDDLVKLARADPKKLRAIQAQPPFGEADEAMLKIMRDDGMASLGPGDGIRYRQLAGRAYEIANDVRRNAEGGNYFPDARLNGLSHTDYRLLFAGKVEAFRGSDRAIRTLPKNEIEEAALALAMQAEGRPLGIILHRMAPVGDPLYPRARWHKMEAIYRTPQGKATVHYWRNVETGELHGFKFKNK